jgi:hypothetical protein
MSLFIRDYERRYADSLLKRQRAAPRQIIRSAPQNREVDADRGSNVPTGHSTYQTMCSGRIRRSSAENP